jgi:large subunit ribosomal protein L29
MKLDEIRAMSDADLRARVTGLEEERFRLRFRGATETLEDPLRLRTVRRDIARALTVLRERQLQAAPAATPGPKAAGKPGTKSAAKAAKPAATPSKAAGQSTRRGKTNAAKAAR